MKKEEYIKKINLLKQQIWAVEELDGAMMNAIEKDLKEIMWKIIRYDYKFNKRNQHGN